MTLLLKGGHRTNDPRLDRIYAQDLNSLKYLVRSTLPSQLVAAPRSFSYQVGVWLDQGQEGACVGFGFSHELAARPVPVLGITNKYARENLYWEIQRRDPWPGGAYPGAAPQYEGTSVLSGAQVLKDLGFYHSYRWGITMREVVMGLGFSGPAVLGLTMRDGMMEPNKKGFLTLDGEIVGGHCILAHSVKIRLVGWAMRDWAHVDLDKSYIVVWNSWGPYWGDNGTAKISLRDLMVLIEGDKGEACFPVRNPDKRSIDA